MAHPDGHEIERQAVAASCDPKTGHQFLPALATLTSARVQHVRATEVVPFAKAFSVVGLRYLDGRADHRMVSSYRREPMAQLVLRLGEEPDSRRRRQCSGHGSKVGVWLVVQAGHEDCPFGRDPSAIEGRPEQVRREHDRRVLLGVAGEVEV